MAFWGAIRAGIVPIPLNTLLAAEQYGYMFADSRAAGAVIAAPMLDMLLAIRPELPHLRAIVVVGAPDGERLAPSVHRFEDVLARAEPAPCAHDHVGRGRVLDVHLGLDRRSEGACATSTPA